MLELVRDITDDLSQRMERRTQVIKEDLARMVQEDKLLALGKLVASVAHEINNPISAIYNFVKLMHKGLANGRSKAKDLQDYQGYLELCAQEAPAMQPHRGQPAFLRPPEKPRPPHGGLAPTARHHGHAHRPPHETLGS